MTARGALRLPADSGPLSPKSMASLPAATRSVNGVVARTPPGGTGGYTVEAGCAGAISFDGGPSFDVFFSSTGGELWMIQTAPQGGSVFQGTARRVTRQRSHK